jgi:phosphopantothenoylcysteine decarboxylase/phosphopantothenate--cysteine ligase
VARATPAGVDRIDVRSAAQMRAAVLAALPGQDAYISAAAIADYTPVRPSAQKIKKTASTIELQLQRTPDVLAEVSAHPQRPRLLVGFAAETSELAAHARGKLRDKGLDMIAGNDVSDSGIGFESEDNALTVFSADASQVIARGPKRQVARELLLLVAQRLDAAP